MSNGALEERRSQQLRMMLLLVIHFQGILRQMYTVNAGITGRFAKGSGTISGQTKLNVIHQLYNGSPLSYRQWIRHNLLG